MFNMSFMPKISGVTRIFSQGGKCFHISPNTARVSQVALNRKPRFNKNPNIQDLLFELI